MDARFARDYPTPEQSLSPNVKLEEVDPTTRSASPRLDLRSPPPPDLALRQPRQGSRSNSTLEVVRPARQRTRTPSIGPSSPEARWSTLHMSYSLTYHLVDTGLTYMENKFRYKTFDYIAYVARLGRSQGRMDAMDLVDHLFSLSQMYIGTYFTNHSALLRISKHIPDCETLLMQDSDASHLEEVGMARRDPFLAIAGSILDQAQQAQFDSRDSEQALEKVSLWYFTITILGCLEAFEPDLLLLVRSIVLQGFDYLAECEELGTDTAEYEIQFKEIMVGQPFV
ncbi:hypothetical protein JCM16303_000243 [Sporobolomyces ruberrimus]